MRARVRANIEEVLAEYMSSQGYQNAFESKWNNQLQAKSGDINQSIIQVMEQIPSMPKIVDPIADIITRQIREFHNNAEKKLEVRATSQRRSCDLRR